MSHLLKFPEFVSAKQLAELGNWAGSRSGFSRCSEIMKNANIPRDAAIAGLFLGLSEYYSGHWEDSARTFSQSFVELSKLQINSPQANTALRYKLGTSIALQALGNESINWQTVLTQDPQTRLCLGQIPRHDSYSRAVWDHLDKKGPSGSSLLEAKESTDVILESFALLSRADMAVQGLPLANSDERDISNEIEMVSKSLKSAERISPLGPEYRLISKWYIGRSLILRGTLFEFNANALMAEGMYRAAADLMDTPLTPRQAILKTLAYHKLGNLLLKWEKRESEGEKLIHMNPLSKASLQVMNTYIPEPTMDELNKVLLD